MRKALGQFSILLALILSAGNAIEGAAPPAASRHLPAGLLRAIQETLGQTPASGTFKQQQVLTASDGAQFDMLGYSVALSGDGSIALIGAPGKNNTGAAYIFTKQASTWTEHQELKATDAAKTDEFGTSVALSSDGSVALIGAPGEISGPVKGAAYIFTEQGNTWTQHQELRPTIGAGDDLFGYSVALSSDGSIALIGSFGRSSFRGVAYIFTELGNTWTDHQELQACNGAAEDDFGYSVALSGDGRSALIGAVHANSVKGAAYVFTEGGSTWTEQQELQARNGEAGDFFGSSVALSSDGSIALIGAQYSNSAKGAAYVFTEHSKTWSQQQELQASDGSSDDVFGYSVALSSDGSIALIGAPQFASPENHGPGLAYIFTENNNVWTEQQELRPPNDGQIDFFGNSVALSASGQIALIGEPFKNEHTGAAYIFTQ